MLSVNDGISYEDLLTESSLMVTDYSGVQFDFAYMKKPIIYYQFALFTGKAGLFI